MLCSKGYMTNSLGYHPCRQTFDRCLGDLNLWPWIVFIHKFKRALIRQQRIFSSADRLVGAGEMVLNNGIIRQGCGGRLKVFDSLFGLPAAMQYPAIGVLKRWHFGATQAAC